MTVYIGINIIIINKTQEAQYNEGSHLGSSDETLHYLQA